VGVNNIFGKPAMIKPAMIAISESIW
jgi:hypothetical protein